MEVADGGDLLTKINSHIKNRTTFSEKQIWSYFLQMVEGIKCLHQMNIYHRDIKCANVFLNKDGVLKLGDLNVSKVVKAGIA
jgi:NIMA (never in mitosis gene a)-related kinase